MSTMPTLFVSHGAPTFALEPGEAGRELAALAQTLPKPRAILVASPHWMAPALKLSAGEQPETIHDFGGFPAPLYDLRYPAPGDPELAARAIARLAGSGIDAQPDPHRGLDHGAWVPLLHMYPDADVPVVQISMPARRPASWFHALGRALSPLREDGVLIVGSGSLTHNLYEFTGAATGTAPYVDAFARWIAETLDSGDVDALLDYRRLAPHADRAHPTDEHLMPLMFAHGAAGMPAGARRLAAADVRYGMLAMDAYVFGAS
ncbi:DODA-type extradiol aromatic ring-opening family dioxygenase [Aromatoleum petrolei]|uniref:Dioxygenase n=1 Tax=Aromatoleum petrolei TaxID=76116 RepID=A0ABX1MSX4_9RHOO|nr:class III extradiol ring-cleavage dioxygenase [Aromatoleum petrolei]NMF90336.1 dioxygenase [Aromatoleum petrolei]QTQ37969.1 Extradiol aromatic ring-opening dioxygenase, DODA-type family protein [Aromatoleum petrolei]